VTILYNQSWGRERRKEFRRESTEAEKALWDVLRDRRLLDVKFRRQYGVGGYILDFYAPQLKFAIEVDGPIHDTNFSKDYDRIREEYLDDVGIEVIHVKNDDVLNSSAELIEQVTVILRERMARFPSLPRRG
jgi:very-short-patch-repair endonuclease